MNSKLRLLCLYCCAKAVIHCGKPIKVATQHCLFCSKTFSFIDFLFFHPFMSLVLAIFLNEANWGALFSWDSSGRNCKCSQKSLKPGFYCYPPGFCSFSVSKLLEKKLAFQIFEALLYVL